MAHLVCKHDGIGKFLADQQGDVGLYGRFSSKECMLLFQRACLDFPGLSPSSPQSPLTPYPQDPLLPTRAPALMCTYTELKEYFSLLKVSNSILKVKDYIYFCLIFLKVYFLFAHMYAWTCVPLQVNMHRCMQTSRRSEEAQHPLEQECQVVVNHLMWMLGSNFQLSARTSALNHRALSDSLLQFYSTTVSCSATDIAFES